MLTLNEESLKEIIPKIGPRVKFLAKLKMFQSIENLPVVVMATNDDISSEVTNFF